LEGLWKIWKEFVGIWRNFKESWGSKARSWQTSLRLEAPFIWCFTQKCAAPSCHTTGSTSMAHHNGLLLRIGHPVSAERHELWGDKSHLIPNHSKGHFRN
jgi:hypothetical protein